MHLLRPVLLALSLVLMLAFSINAKEIILKSEANVMVEESFTAQRPHSDPFNNVTLDVVFKDPSGHEFRVPAFWDGGKIWKVRYASPVVGRHTFRTECSDILDEGLHGITAEVEIKPYTGRNPLYLHGPLHVSESHRFLEHADGKPFFWLGDTWWMGLCGRLRWPQDVQRLAADRKLKGFTVIQIVAGLYPDMFPFDPRGANEAGYPWETNYSRIRPQYFDGADERLKYLVNQGFTPCIVGAWGYFMPWMGVDKMKAHWRYLIARYGAMPVVWCAAGEANLPWYLAPGFPYDDRRQVSNWTQVMRYIRETDPYHRPLTIHPTGIGRLSARNATDDSALLDFDMLQTPHGQREAVPVTLKTVRDSFVDTPRLPVIDGEASYEMLGDYLPTRWSREMFWLCLMNGAAGHTYGANGIWQVNRPGQPHGPSPHHHGGVGYGKIPWDEAMNLPGSQQVGLGKKLLEQFEWWKLEPHPEWVSYDTKPAMNFDAAQWIWFPEGNPAQNAPAGKRFFERRFNLPEDKKIKNAQLLVSADDWFAARLNGKVVGSSPKENEAWRIARQFNDLTSTLHPGVNVLAIEAENIATPNDAPNPAGLIARLEIKFEDGQSFDLPTDNQWQCGRTANAAIDRAIVIARHGEGPWGKISADDNHQSNPPQAAGIGENVRIFYAPEPNGIVVRDLKQRTEYAATYFDPVTGKKMAMRPFRMDEKAEWIFHPPKGEEHDWVLILTAKNK